MDFCKMDFWIFTSDMIDNSCPFYNVGLSTAFNGFQGLSLSNRMYAIAVFVLFWCACVLYSSLRLFVIQI